MSPTLPSVGKINPNDAVAHFGLITPNASAVRMAAHARIQIELPVVPGARNGVSGDLAGGQVPAGMRAGIVHNDHPLGFFHAEDGQLAPVVLDECTTALAAAA